MLFDKSHINRRAIYTDRSNVEHRGTIRGVIPSVKQIDFCKDGSKRNTYYVPMDAVRLDTEEMNNATD